MALWAGCRITPYSSAEIARFKMGCRRSHIFLANVRGEVSLLAFGTKACPAGDVPKVPKGQGLARPLRSAYFCFDSEDCILSAIFLRIS